MYFLLFYVIYIKNSRIILYNTATVKEITPIFIHKKKASFLAS